MMAAVRQLVGREELEPPTLQPACTPLENRGKNEGEGREKERDEEVRPEEDEKE
jgi:hypothetical protein